MDILSRLMIKKLFHYIKKLSLEQFEITNADSKIIHNNNQAQAK